MSVFQAGELDGRPVQLTLIVPDDEFESPAGTEEEALMRYKAESRASEQNDVKPFNESADQVNKDSKNNDIRA